MQVIGHEAAEGASKRLSLCNSDQCVKYNDQQFFFVFVAGYPKCVLRVTA